MSVSSAHADPSLCWNCRETVSDADICPSCVKIQPIGRKADFYSVLGLPVRLVLESAQLTGQFHAKSRIFHPDFHQGEESGEQLISLENASMVNQAFKTLKDPFERAAYFLDLMNRMDSLLEGGTDVSRLPEKDRSALRQALEYRKYLKSIERDLKPRPGALGTPKH